MVWPRLRRCSRCPLSSARFPTPKQQHLSYGQMPQLWIAPSCAFGLVLTQDLATKGDLVALLVLASLMPTRNVSIARLATNAR